MSHTTLTIIFSVLMIPGIVGVFLPFIPAISYMFILAVIYGIVDNFVHLSAIDLTILGIIWILSLAVDYFSGVFGARFGGAHKKSLLLGLIGLPVGLLLFPPFGGIIGVFAGIVLGELMEMRGHIQALRAASASLIGSLIGVAINACLAILFLVLFIVFNL